MLQFVDSFTWSYYPIQDLGATARHGYVMVTLNTKWRHSHKAKTSRLPQHSHKANSYKQLSTFMMWMGSGNGRL